MKFAISILYYLLILISGEVQGIHKNPGPIPIDWYDCSGKEPGRYMHTIDCTKFIVCDEEEKALEVRCPNCTHIKPHLCPHGRLLFNDEEKICFPASLTKCNIAEDTSPPVEPTDSPTSTMPTVSTSSPTSTTSPYPTTTVPPEDPHKPGNECDHEKCTNIGYHCQSYLRCEKVIGKLVEEECGKDLFWNPLTSNGTKQIHGGNCDLLENLLPETLQKYKEDPECNLE